MEAVDVAALGRRIGACIYALVPIRIGDAERRAMMGEVEFVWFQQTFMDEIQRGWQQQQSTSTAGDSRVPTREFAMLKDGSHEKWFPNLLRGPCLPISALL